jgi:nucleolar protein 14
MYELIAKSKMYKHERQQQHEEDIEDIEALDAELPSLQSLLRSVTTQKLPRLEKTAEMLSYDAAIREMVYDKRSKPTERTKTEEEIAQEEMERLQRLEKERLRRMRGEDVNEDEGGKARREGDDFDDDFVPDVEDEDFYGLGKGAAESGEEDVSAEDDGSMPEGEENIEEESEDDEDDEEDNFDISQYFTDEETGEIPYQDDEDDDDIIPSTKRLRIQEPSSAPSKELAYTFPCPSTMEEMLDILKDVTTDAIPIVIERIEILHSTKLLAENRQKLETLTPIVLKLILSLAGQKPMPPFNTINALVVRFHGLAMQFPAVLTLEFIAALEASRKRFANSFVGEKKTFPTEQELILFYTIGQIYPPSDLVHAVVNPTMLFMGQILGQMKVKTVQDLARGFFVASLFLQVLPLPCA